MSALVGIVASHVTAFISSPRKALHNARGIGFGHLDVREFAQQVDMSHGHTTLNIAVDKLHHLARIETIVFTKVNEQTAITGLGLAYTTRTALRSLAACTALGIATASAFGSFALALVTFLRGFLYLGRIGIIV